MILHLVNNLYDKRTKKEVRGNFTMAGVWPSKYFQNPNPKESIEEIWDDIDGYSFELMYQEENMHDKIDFVIPLPPLKNKGKVIKGMFYSQATQLILDRFPDLKKIFFACANTMFSSYSYSKDADVYLTCYDNKIRETYYKNKYPEKKDIIFAPLQDCDFMNEYEMAPTFNTPKIYDVICVSTAYPVKNLPMLASALKEYEKKYGRILKALVAIGSKDAFIRPDGTMDYSKVRFDAKEELEKIDKILGDTRKYIEFRPYIDHKDLPKFYTQAKCCILTSLMEGKNRAINESMSCDTPIVVFRDFNKFARGEYPIFQGNSGEYVPYFDAGSLADTIHKVINNQRNYDARENYLRYNGRKHFVNTLVDLIPYYRENLPEYRANSIQNNIWIDLACQKNYQLSYLDFLYGKNCAIQHVRGLKNIENLINFFYSRFKIKP